jgi:hypothetical protein
MVSGRKRKKSGHRVSRARRRYKKHQIGGLVFSPLIRGTHKKRKKKGGEDDASDINNFLC